MSETALGMDPSTITDYSDLSDFDVTVLAPERTLAEKLAFLHHRASIGDAEALTAGARHLYDVAMLLRNDRVREALDHGQIAELMVDIDSRSEAAGWGYTPRPADGFASSPAFDGRQPVDMALRTGYAALLDLVWGALPSFDEAIEIIRSSGSFI